MRILHTSDWHLGQKLLYYEREEEHRLALDWLLKTIVDQQVDVLLVAGDVFDIGNPPNYARRTYYRFLSQLLQTQCRHVVITGGNHDSPAMLNAPKELLESLNIHIIGAATDQPADELIVLQNDQGQAEAVVAAVPFLRDRDLRVSIAAETFEERQQRLQEAIRLHYETLAELAQPFVPMQIPIVATGHLYASGATSQERQDNIYVGNRENIEAGQFPTTFHYVALGHIHRAQVVGLINHVRYSGSLIPLSFSETKDDKSVYLLHFKQDELSHIETLPVPVFRRLKTISGELEEVKNSLVRFASDPDRILTPWVEVIVQAQSFTPGLDEELREFCRDMPIELLKIKMEYQYRSLQTDAQAPLPDLDELDVDEVFLRRCEIAGEMSSEEKETLLKTFQELREWMQTHLNDTP